MRKPVSRRSFLAGTAGGLVAPMVLTPLVAAAKSDSITYVTWGGSWQDVQVENVIKPFTEETGVKVNIVTGPDLAKVKAQQVSGNVQWDVIDCDSPMAASGSKQGFWETLDPSIFDVGDLIFPMASD